MKNQQRDQRAQRIFFIIIFIVGVLTGVAISFGYHHLFDSSNNSVPDQRPFGTLMKEAGIAFNAKNYEDAKRLYASALVQDSANYDANRMSAVLLVRNTTPPDLVKALGCMRNALKIKRDFVDLIFLAEILWKSEQYVESESVAKECLKLKPDDFNALELMGYVLRQQKRDGEALKYYRRALKVEPNSLTVKEAINSLAK